MIGLSLFDWLVGTTGFEPAPLCRFSSDQMQRRIQRGALLEADLRRALTQGELLLHYQPQVTLAPGALGISAMVRWAHPELGLIGPERFLPLAENSGLVPTLTEWLCQAACTQARYWSELDLGPVHLALPLLSRQQLRWSGLPGRLQDCLRDARLSPTRLEIEITEPLLLADAEAGGAGITALDEIGVRIALDDFGSGPMSLRSLELGLLEPSSSSARCIRRCPVTSSVGLWSERPSRLPRISACGSSPKVSIATIS